ncbi:hypothetical protein [Sphingomonas quercus]|uniref:Uncharacterized protein n=1 Tax=Sphingomonas quercus TaxID=2842451 RepID=A0ABS6BEK0_9SPHN|nr:hypothetical protein [Sphingomonas quercus]MBU3076740.1 hypothetical protein [Sphingomonas quercus]
MASYRSRAQRGALAGLLASWTLAAAPAEAQLFWNPPDFRGAPVNGGEEGMGQPMPGATPAELSAHLLWNLRAGLNVAALQCQFSPTLGTVRNYNDLIAHHAKELAGAYATLGKYFLRTKGKGKPGQLALDQYNTKTYNGFSTLRAQLGFCQTASQIGREALTLPKGQLLTYAKAHMREFRNSLVPAYERVFNMAAWPTYPTPRLDDACWTKADLLKYSCGNWRAVSLAQPTPAPAPAANPVSLAQPTPAAGAPRGS